MLTPRFVGRLRGSGVWGVGRRVHVVIVAPICRAIHAMVRILGPRLVSTDLALKHVYDYRLVYVNPASIESSLYVGSWRLAGGLHSKRIWSMIKRWHALGGGWKSAQRHVTRSMHGRFVASGDWDSLVRPLHHRLVVRELFLEGKNPDQTDEYQILRHRIEAGDFALTHGCLSVDDLDRYFDNLIDTFESIRTSGYKTQLELGLDGSDEIRVCIDRHGRLCLFSGGTHRLAMARILDLDRVPVLVKRVHALWVANCMTRSGATDVLAAIADAIGDLEAGSAAQARTP